MPKIANMEFLIYLTFRCNFHCNMCTQGEEFRKADYNELSAVEWGKLFDDLTQKIEHPRLVIMGGEPLLHKNFDEFLNLAYKKGLYTHVITNGALLFDHFDTIVKTKTTLTLSLHGLENTQNSITGCKNSFQKTMSALKEIKKISSKNKPFFHIVNSVVLPENIEEMKEFTELICKDKLTHLFLNHPRFVDEKIENETREICEKSGFSSSQKLHLQTNKNYKFDKKYVAEVNEFFNNLNPNRGNFKVVEFPNFTEEERFLYYGKNFSEIRGKRLCSYPWRVPFILPNGDIATCLYNTVGNFTEDNFWKIWGNEKAEKFRKYLQEKGNLPCCKRCTCYYDANYIFAPQKIIRLKNGQKLSVSSEMTLVPPSCDGYFVRNIDLPIENDVIPVIPMAFVTEKERKHIENCEQIIAKFSDL